MTRSLTVILLLWGGLAHAIPVSNVLDFRGYADDKKADHYVGESIWKEFSYKDNGLTVRVTGGSSRGFNDYYAYLDAKNAGMGVCKQPAEPPEESDLDTYVGKPKKNDDNACSPSSDDNITAGEWVRLVFDHVVTLTSFSFTNGKHKTNWAEGAAFDFWVDNVFEGKYNFDSMAVINNTINGVSGRRSVWDLTTLSNGGITGSIFDFGFAGSGSGDKYRFYLVGGEVGYQPHPSLFSAPANGVDAPSPLLLGLAGLGIIGLRRRRLRLS